MPTPATYRVPMHICAVLLAACASFGALESTTTIDPGQAFRLGGGQAGAFLVQGRNAGPVAVIVYLEQSGSRDSVTTVVPGAAVDARFPAGAMAVFRNTSSTRAATVAIRVTGDIGNLGMSYEANRKP